MKATNIITTRVGLNASAGTSLEMLSYLALCCLAICPPLHADGYRFSTVQVPGSDLTEADGINARGVIVGSYVDSDGVSHGFLLRDGKFKTIDVPGALENIAARGINARGDIVGSFVGADSVRHGFLRSDGKFTQIDYPGSTGTYMSGINNAGDVTGGYFIAGGGGTFIRRNGKFYNVNIPGGSAANVRAAQDNGRVLVGSAIMTFDGGFHGFVRRKPGEFELIDLPARSVPCGGVRGINQRGDMVGGFAYLTRSRSATDPNMTGMAFCFELANSRSSISLELRSPTRSLSTTTA